MRFLKLACGQLVTGVAFGPAGLKLGAGLVSTAYGELHGDFAAAPNLFTAVNDADFTAVSCSFKSRELTVSFR